MRALEQASRCLGEAQLVQPVVIPVRPEEKMADYAVPVVGISRRVRSARRGIVWKVEDARRRAGRPSGRIDPIRCNDVQPGVDVVSGSRIAAVGDPSKVVEGGQFADERKGRP